MTSLACMNSLTLKGALVLSGCLFPLVVGALLIIRGDLRVYFNATESLSPRVYVRFPAGPAVLEREQYVVFTHFRYPKEYLIKQIKGVAGDTITVQGGHLTIGKNTLPLLPRTREGETLYPLSTRVVPQGFVFVAGTHSQSFDSRYKGFGLVHQSQIKGRVCPLF